MNKNVVISVLSVAAVALAATSLHLLMKQREPGRAASPTPPEPASTVESRAPPAPADEKPEAPFVPSAGGPGLSPAAPAPAAPPARPSLMAGLAEMIKSPEMKNILRSQMKMTLDTQYGSLFKYLNLPPEQMDAMKEILLDRQMAMMDAGMNLMSPGTNGAGRAEMAQRVKELNEGYNQKFAQLLGEEQYGVFRQYEDTQPERTQVQMLKQTMGGAEGLTEQQEHDLIRAMYEERQTMTTAGAFPDQSNPDPATFTEQGMQKALDQLGTLQDRYAIRAAEILNPAQMERFKSHQTQQRAMQQMGIKMAAQLFGQPGAAPAAAPPPQP